ncbi:hypothetical protein LBMAG41_20540 [Cyanobium sp.]|nr:hypothetical protein LBMAG41_20540 [Cyanobium sp.]
MDTPRGIPTSRAYWDLQAEKLMNRIFDPVDTIDLPTDADRSALDALALPALEEVANPGAAAAPASRAPRWQRARRPQASAQIDPFRSTAVSSPAPLDPAVSAPVPQRGLQATLATLTAHQQPLMLIGAFAAAGLVSASSGVLALSQWNRFQDSLRQERSLLLVERLRNFGPATQAPATPPAPALAPPTGLTAQAGAPQTAMQAQAYSQGARPTDNDLPPPPPQEAWIEQLGELPQRSAPILRVPVSPKLAAAAAAPVRRSPPPGPLPLLVGVVGAPGKVGSAIFQMGGSTSTVSVGETIGNSGWRLRSTDGDSVQIEHDGDLRRIAIGSGG